MPTRQTRLLQAGTCGRVESPKKRKAKEIQLLLKYIDALFRVNNVRYQNSYAEMGKRRKRKPKPNEKSEDVFSTSTPL
jgi:hypothetical protein